MPIPGTRATASVSYTAAALARLRTLQPDIVHAHELFSPGTTALAAKAGVLVVLTLTRMYRPRFSLSALDDLPQLLTAMAFPLLVTALVAFVEPPDPSFFAAVAVVVVALPLTRALTYALVRRRRISKHMRRHAIIVGSGAVAASLVNRAQEHPEHGLDPVGFVDTDHEGPDGVSPAVPYLGTLESLNALICEHDASVLILAFGRLRESDWIGLMRAAVASDVEVHVIPRFFELGVTPPAGSADAVRGMPLQMVRRAAMRRQMWAIKRLFDVAVAGVGLVVTAPLLAAVGVAVRLSSPGPVLFRQLRIGQDGREFELLKFRSMRVEHDGDKTWSVDGASSAMTSVGSFIRKTSIDELPQLWNILRGDMSLIGPRPERPHFVEEFRSEVPGYSDRHRLPVGLTGWAQISGLRGDTSIAERALYDNYYIERWSFWFDLRILIRTGSAVARDCVRAGQERMRRS